MLKFNQFRLIFAAFKLDYHQLSFKFTAESCHIHTCCGIDCQAFGGGCLISVERMQHMHLLICCMLAQILPASAVRNRALNNLGWKLFNAK
jgi:hypothetical protein